MKGSLRQSIAVFLCISIMFGYLSNITPSHANMNRGNDFSVASSSNSKPVTDGEMNIELNDVEIELVASASNATRALNYSTTIDNRVITIKAEPGVLPDEVEVGIKKIETDQQKEIEEKIKSDIISDSKTLESVFAVDITFYYEGEEVQPDGLVDVNFEMSETIKSDIEIEMFHVEKENGNIEKIKFEKGEANNVNCLVNSFSVYGIAQYNVNYIEIYTVEDLININSNLSGIYKLMNDIDLSEVNWVPLAFYYDQDQSKYIQNYFSGTLDGNGHVITNMVMNYQSNPEDGRNILYRNMGLFSRVSGGEIKNLTLSNCSLLLGSENQDYTSPSAGFIGGSISNADLSNCHVIDSSIAIYSCDLFDTLVGGLIGEFDGNRNPYYPHSVISNCSFSGSIEINADFADSFAENLICGGIVGNFTSGKIIRSSNNAEIIINSEINSRENVFIGGIVGNLDVESDFDNSYYSEISECYNSADITITNIAYSGFTAPTLYAGGITGRSSGLIKDVYNTGNIHCENSVSRKSSKRPVLACSGGIVGLLDNKKDNSHTSITNAYNLGDMNAFTMVGYSSFDKVREDESFGGIVGQSNLSSISVQNCYYKIDEYYNDYIHIGSGSCNSFNVYALSEAEANAFLGFDFDEIWEMNEDTNFYPIFRWQNDAEINIPKPKLRLISSVPNNLSNNAKVGDDLVLNFSEPICSYIKFDFENGDISVYEYDTDVCVYKYDLHKNSIIGGENREKLLLYNALKECRVGKRYYVLITPGFLESEEGLDFDGIISKDKLTFQVGQMNINFPDSGESQDVSWNFIYADEYFFENSALYNHSLAKLSLGFAMAGFMSADESSYELKNKNIIDVYNQANFTNVRTEEYGKPSHNSIGSAMSSKTIKDGRDEEYTLISVVIRGAGYEREWVSNVMVEGSNYLNHYGFSEAADTVYSRLENYISDNDIKGNIKIWICGYSRAAAVSNILAAKINKTNKIYDAKITSENIFAYTFATPLTVDLKNVNTFRYNNIYNIINSQDLVPRVPLLEWGFARYGRDLYFNPTVNLYSEALPTYNKINGYGDKGYEVCSNQEMIITEFTNILSRVVKDRDDYKRSLQPEVSHLINDFYNANDWNVDENTTPKIFSEIISIIIRFVRIESMVHFDKITNFGSNAGVIFSSHYPNTYLSYMETFEPEELFRDTGYKSIIVKCPVDVYVYNNERLVAEIINNSENLTIDDGLFSIVHGDEKKIYIPNDEIYNIKLVGTGQGTMQYLINEYKASGELSRTVSYKNIKINDTITYTGVVDNLMDTDANNYNLVDNNGTKIIFTTDSNNPNDENNNGNNNDNQGRPSGGRGGGSRTSSTPTSPTSMIKVIDGTNYKWKQNETGWWLEDSAGKYPTNSWALKDNIYYWFGTDGYMVTGWNMISSKWFYFHTSGAMVFNAWLLDNNHWYFFNPDGSMKTGWLEWNGNHYYFDTSGAMLVNTTTPDGYYVNDKGEWEQ